MPCFDSRTRRRVDFSSMCSDTQLPRTRRLRSREDFQRVYDRRCKCARGPLSFFAAEPATGDTRLGLSVRRGVGTAPQRNRIKRLLREAFRLRRADLPRPLDLVIVVRPHPLLTLRQYMDLLTDAVGTLALRLEATP